jgi:hypothetical protein
MPRIKRKPGGQPGNHNARKHGFYSRTLAPEQLANLPPATRTPGLDAEIALLRIKIRSIVQDDPHNLDPLLRTVSTLRLAVKTWYDVTRRNRLGAQAIRRRSHRDLEKAALFRDPPEENDPA